MKPISVKMQAFGPYTEGTECDFTSLYEARLFLITGPTGSGKTTILDAMSFALYGFATGGLRDFRDMRNTSAPDDMDTEVSFSFSLGTEKYNFIRRITRKKKRTGEYSEQISAECYRANGKNETGFELLSTGAEAVRKKAIEVLGFTHSQFSQVIVLPQGEFRKLLVAKSNDKLEILQVLFATSYWKQLTDSVSFRLKNIRTELAKLSTGKETLLESAGAETIQELEDMLRNCEDHCTLAGKDAGASKLNMDKANESYNKAAALCDRFAERDKWDKALSLLENRKMEMNGLKDKYDLAVKCRELRPYYEKHVEYAGLLAAKLREKKSAELFLKNAEEAFVTSKAKYDRIGEAENRERIFRDQIAAITPLLPDSARLDSLRKENAVLHQEILLSENNSLSMQKEYEAIVLRIEKGEKFVKELFEKHILPADSLHAALAETDKQLENLKQYTLAKTAETSAVNEDAAAAKQLAYAESKLEHQTQRLELLENEIKSNSAYTLALTLKEGEACPVCGSNHHPSPHKAGDSSVNRQDMDSAKKALIAARREADRCRTLAGECSARRISAAEAVAKIVALCAGYDNETTLLQNKKDLEEQITGPDEAKKKYEFLSAALDKLKIKRDDLSDQLNALRPHINDLQVRFSGNRSAIDEIVNRMPEGVKPEQLKAELESAERKAKEIKTKIEFIKTEHEAAKLSLANHTQSVKSADLSLKETEQRLVDANKELDIRRAAAELSPDLEIMGGILDDDTMAEIDQKLRQYERSLLQAKEQHAALSLELKDKCPPDMEAIKENRESATAKFAEDRKILGSLQNRLATLKDTAKKLSEYGDAGQKLESEYSKVSRVSEFMAGRKNSHRTSIHGFVVGLMLDEVVQSASRYLLKLSRGRYQLIRVDTVGGNELKGLDIEVTDAHTGGQRRVCTLSGGELFLASLSLAFGLAEIVQSYAGGVSFDSIFIDEGFGTLDSETLEAAMKALAIIQKEGRLVGLISHVAELKSRIPARIEVLTGSDGSTLRVKQM